jgi:phenol 2-monooxygenase
MFLFLFLYLIMVTPYTARNTATLAICQEQARKIFHPYTLTFGGTDWFSIYKIGQRLANTCT